MANIFCSHHPKFVMYLNFCKNNGGPSNKPESNKKRVTKDCLSFCFNSQNVYLVIINGYYFYKTTNKALILTKFFKISHTTC